MPLVYYVAVLKTKIFNSDLHDMMYIEDMLTMTTVMMIITDYYINTKTVIYVTLMVLCGQ